MELVAAAILSVVYILLAICATYGMSFVLVYKDGPFNIFEKFRSIRVIEKFGLFECVPCLSFWVSIPVCLIFGIPMFAFIGIWGSVIILDRLLSYHLLK